MMLVGEQPGDHEDREGHVFVGPAGRLLDEALEEAGIDRGAAYLTNVVKHFRYEERGKRRIHQRPGADHLAACRQWWQAELDVVAPTALVCLGAVAAKELMGGKVRVTRDRGRRLDFPELAPIAMVTVHPSSVVRRRAGDDFEARYAAFVDDLRAAARALDEHGAHAPR
jgi:DNA polymerase